MGAHRADEQPGWYRLEHLGQVDVEGLEAVDGGGVDAWSTEDRGGEAVPGLVSEAIDHGGETAAVVPRRNARRLEAMQTPGVAGGLSCNSE